MTAATSYSLLIILLVLILISGFFSGSETGMMAVNRYRLRHLVKKGNKQAKRVVDLLKKPDRLLGTILIGNTFANILAASIATVVATHYFGELGVLVSTIGLTIILLIFSEIAPKTLAALYPQPVALKVSVILKGLLMLLYPLVWLLNAIANTFLYLFGIRVREHVAEPLTTEELRTVVREVTAKTSSSYQHMLIRVLNLGQMTVEDVMIPRNRIVGINLNSELSTIIKQLSAIHYRYLPIYRDNIDHVEGLLDRYHLLNLLSQDDLKKERFLSLALPIYFIPEATLLSQQLLNFQEERKTTGLVVDEYGEIQGLVTLNDIIEEIVGEFAESMQDSADFVRRQSDGSFLVDARIGVRDLNRITKWHLPTTEGPKTLSGLILEDLEMIPNARVGLRLAGYPMEIIKVSGNIIRVVQVWPEKWLPAKLVDELP